MPYIEAARRDAILEDLGIAHDSKHNVRSSNRPVHRFLSPGELNFAISALLHEYILDHGMRYATLSEAAAQAQHAASEFYRTVVAPYEDKKRQEHGPVSNLDTPWGS